MGYNIKMWIFIKKGKEPCIGEVINSLLKIGAIIDKRDVPSFFTSSPTFAGSLNEMRKLISKHGGSIPFSYSSIDFDLVYFFPEHTLQPLSLVGIQCDRANFRKDSQKIVSRFVELSKCVWNSLGDEKIFGLADLETGLEAILDYLKKNGELSEEGVSLESPHEDFVNFYNDELAKKLGLKTISASNEIVVRKVKGGVMTFLKKVPYYLKR